MAKHRHKHHRKVNQNRFNAGRSAVVNEPTNDALVAGTTTGPATAANASEADHVMKDLRVTGYVTVALILLLVLGSYVNVKTHWTLHFGDLLYRVLHIG